VTPFAVEGSIFCGFGWLDYSNLLDLFWSVLLGLYLLVPGVGEPLAPSGLLGGIVGACTDPEPHSEVKS
jgi:hypothetical protein